MASLKDAALQAAIMAGTTFFAVLAGLQVAQIRTDPVSALLAAGISAGAVFFGRLGAAAFPQDVTPTVPP